MKAPDAPADISSLGLPSTTITPERVAAEHVIVSPSPSRLFDTVMEWFGAAGAEPARVSTCNNLSVMILTILEGVAIGVLPARVVRREIAQGLLSRLNVSPAIRPHRVSICYQSAEFGPGIEAVVSLARQLIAEKELLLPV